MESQNYFRLHLLLNGEGSQILREIFKRRYRQLKNIEWENSDKSSREFLQTFSKTTNCLTIQREMLKQKDLNQFDISLLSSLISHVDDLLTGLEKLQGCSKPENSAIAELVRLRNRVAHLPEINLDANLFEELWEKIGKTLVRLGVTEDSINKIRTGTKYSVSFQRDEKVQEGIGSKYKGFAFQRTQTVKEELGEVKIQTGDGDLARDMGDSNTAISNFSSAMLNHRLPDAKRLSMLMNRSEVLFESIFGTVSLPSQDEVNEKCQRAMADVEEIIKTDPKFYKAYLLAGKIHQCTKSWKLAINMFDQALALNPKLPEALKLRNECRYELSRENKSGHRNPQSDGRRDVDPETQNVDLDKNLTVSPSKHDIFKENEKLLNDPDDSKRASACHFFGSLYEDGVDVKLDYRKARKYYEKAVKLGCTLSMCYLGYMYIEGRGVPCDVEKGGELIERAAMSQRKDKGRAEAQYWLGKHYERGIGKPKHLCRAVEWYIMASGNGCGQAAYELGRLFYDGHGVPKNIENAKNYFQLAAMRGFDDSMAALAWMYLNEFNPEFAEHWFNESLQRGNRDSILRKDEFLSSLAEIRQAIEECEKKFYSTVENIGPELMELFRKASSTEALDPFEQIHTCGKPMCAPRERVTGKFGSKQKIEIEKRALAGSEFARDILYSMNWFAKGNEAMEMWRSGGKKDKSLELKALKNISKALRRQNATMFLECDKFTDLREISYVRIEEEHDKVDLNVYACYAWIMVECHPEGKHVRLLESIRDEFPGEKIFYKLLVQALASEDKFAEALDVTNQALKIFPKDSAFLYQKASVMKDLIESVGKYTYEDIIKAYEEFIACASSDDKLVPNARYDMAYLTSTIGKNISDSYEVMKKYYEQGLEAEEKVLPCFIPYDASPVKGICESLLEKKKKGKSVGSIVVIESQFKTKIPSNVQPPVPPRDEVVIRFRKMPNKTVIASANDRSEIVKGKLKQRKPHKLKNFTEITFSEMITTKNHLYSGRLLNLTVTEDPKAGNEAIHIIAKDKNNDNLLIAFFEMDKATAMDQLSFGSQICIINPFFLFVGVGGLVAIWVDELGDVFVDSKVNKCICRYCWKENPALACTKCKRAKYCSRECQSNDWKLLQHKFICN